MSRRFGSTPDQQDHECAFHYGQEADQWRRLTTQKSSSDPADTVASSITRMPMSDLISGLTFGNGLSETASYDQDYQLTGLDLADSSTPVISLSYSYGDDINLTAITDAVTSANSVTLSYTAANRLSSASGPWGSLSWSYDGVGNRLSETLTPPSSSAVTTVSVLPGTSNKMSSQTVSSTMTRSFCLAPPTR